VTGSRSGFGVDEFGIHSIGEPRYNFVLHIEQVRNGLVKALARMSR